LKLYALGSVSRLNTANAVAPLEKDRLTEAALETKLFDGHTSLSLFE
jgi:hypothetical protein